MNRDWLIAQATKLAHPDQQVRVKLVGAPFPLVVTLSLPETESAVRRLMQAHADAIGKSITFHAVPSTTGIEVRPKHVCGLRGFGKVGDVCPACAP